MNKTVVKFSKVEDFFIKISIRVVAIDKMMINDDEVGIDMNQDIKKYIDSNIPKNLYSKYEIVKNKLIKKNYF